MLLEQRLNETSTFLTLTYDEKNLPPGGSLVPRDVQLFLKRLRKEYYPLTIRYYGVGEYGENTERPHYHAIIFGGPTCLQWPVRKGEGCQCPSCQLYQRSWGKGFIYLGDATEKSIKYVASYVSKSTLKKSDPKLFGRHPEYAFMSRRPGIGYGQVRSIAESLTTHYGCESISNTGDVPFSFQYGKKHLPLGNYLRRKIRKELGHEENAPKECLEKQKEKVRELLEENELDPNLKGYALSSALRSIFKGPVSCLESKFKSTKQKKEL